MPEYGIKDFTCDANHIYVQKVRGKIMQTSWASDLEEGLPQAPLPRPRREGDTT